MTVPEPTDYGLVMPFIACTSQGGPYDDQAFVAGWECGWLEAKLAALTGLGSITVERYVHTESVPQIDLIAMKHGMHVTAEPWDEHPDEWTKVIITTAPPIVETGQADG